MFKFSILIALIILTISNFAQQVTTMVPAGQDDSQFCAISPNNKYIAKLGKNKATIWDFKSGRLVREISTYSKVVGLPPVYIGFSEDDAIVHIGTALSEYMNTVNIESGVRDSFKVAVPKTIDEFMKKHNEFAMLLESTTPNIYRSPDLKSAVIYKNVKLDAKEWFFEIFIETNGVKSEKLGHSNWVNYAFSKDSRYLFANTFVYDFFLNQKVCDLKTVPLMPIGAGFLPKSNTIFTAGKNEIITWDFPNLKKTIIQNLGLVVLSSNKEYISYQSYDYHKKELKCGITRSISDRVKDIVKFDVIKPHLLAGVSDDGNYILISSPDGTRIYNAINGEMVHVFPDLKMSDRCFFTKDNDVVGFTLFKKNGFKYNIEKNKTNDLNLQKILALDKNTTASVIGYDNNHLLVYSMNVNGTIISYNYHLWNMETNSINTLSQKELLGGMIFGLSNDASCLAITKGNHDIFVYNPKTNEIKYELKGHNAIILDLTFSDDNKKLISSAADGTSKYWDMETGKEIATIISTGNEEHIITTPEQYYLSTKGAAEYVHFVKGDKLFGVEQFDIKYNRPDIVLEKMGLGDKKVIEAYRKAYYKRLKKMKLTEEMLSDDLNLPEIRITNGGQITTSTENDELKLNLSYSDKKFNIDRINIWINDVALYGTNGLSIKGKKNTNGNELVTLKLKKGQNKIQVSVLNTAGAESYKETVTVNCTKGKEKPDLYLICIGSGEFKQSEFNLTYAAKDAKDMSEAFKANKNYGNVFTKTLTNKEVTLSNVIKLKELLKTADRNDEVILFYAGHGVLDENLDYYLSTGDMNFTNPSVNGITYETLEGILDSIAPLKKVLFIDACHSGEIDKEEVQAASSQNSNSGITFRSVGSAIAQKETYLGLDNTSELSKTLFTDLRRGTGATVISSAGGKEYAMESDAWKNGLFTYCLLHGLKDAAADTNKDGQIMLSELQQYLRNEVTNLSNGAQKPTSRIENLSMDFKIW